MAEGLISSIASLPPSAKTAFLLPVGAFAVAKFLQWLVPGPQHRQRYDFKDKTVLITGASTGLGRALALTLHAKGARLILVARSIDKLEQLTNELKESGKGVHDPKFAYLDLADPQKVEELVRLSHNGKIDVLVNNAGISMRGSVLETQLTVQRQVLEVNYFGQVAVTRALLPFIPDDGMIIVTSSLQAKMALPYRSAYSASKHAVQAFFDSLRGEERWGLHILTVAAGYINTDLGQNALTTSGTPTGAADGHLLKGMQPEYAAKKIVEFCNYRGYVKLNRSKLEKDIRDLKGNIERELYGKSQFEMDADKVGSFVSTHAYLLGGFTAGLLLGYAIA